MRTNTPRCLSNANLHKTAAARRKGLTLALMLGEPADESPSAAKFADCQHQLVAALPQRQIDGVVLRVDDAEEPGIAEILSASPTKEYLAIQGIPNFEQTFKTFTKR
jgi:hypothetical protein